MVEIGSSKSQLEIECNEITIKTSVAQLPLGKWCIVKSWCDTGANRATAVLQGSIHILQSGLPRQRSIHTFDNCHCNLQDMQEQSNEKNSI